MDQSFKDYPKLKGFAQHGVIFTNVHGDHATGTCPFCSKRKHFFVNVTTQRWDCKKCGENGGFSKFLELQSDVFAKELKGSIAVLIAKNRGLEVRTLKRWKVGWNGEIYTVPVSGLFGTTDIRRYVPGRKSISTSGSKVGLMKEEGKNNVVWVCEGEWDTLAMSEIVHKTGKSDSVVGVTGAGSFPKTATGFFQRRDVRLIFDNDEAGRKGELRTRDILQGIAKSIVSVHWPESLPEGFDVRDLYLKEKKNSMQTLRVLKRLLGDEPRKTIEVKAEETEKEPEPSGEGLEFGEVVIGYRKWLKIKDTEVISVLYGALFANRLDGDPMWMFLVAPPGGMKTELLMSLSDSPGIMTTTSLTPPALISGMNTVGGDPSLIPKLDGKVLIVKDFTTILNMPTNARDEIFGILRDAYDGECEKFFGNGVWRQYKSKFGVIGGVTPIIETFSNLSSVLGERFLKYKLKLAGKINVGSDAIMRALSNINKETKMRDNLKAVANEALDLKLDDDDIPEVSDHMMGKFMRLSQWVACMRGVVSREKYTREIQFKPTAEVGTRLAKQLCKLAMGIAIFHRKKEVDEDTYQIVVSVAKDTAPDRVEEVVRQLYIHSEEEYVSTQAVSEWTKFPTPTVSSLMQDLTLLGVVQKEAESTKGFWKLSTSVLRLMKPLDIYTREEAWKKGKRGRK